MITHLYMIKRNKIYIDDKKRGGGGGGLGRKERKKKIKKKGLKPILMFTIERPNDLAR